MLTHLRVADVRQAYAEGIHLVAEQGIAEPSRNGPVLVMPGPLVTTYQNPQHRVLLDPLRDANPFFHLMESLWMLAGRRDVESLMHFNSGMAKYSDDGVSFHGAYGHRWRRHYTLASGGRDQLVEIVTLLRMNPSDRRVVLQMWDPEVDLAREGLDFPCNNLCYFRVRHHHQMAKPVGGVWSSPGEDEDWDVLDMTIACRSNDMLWGGWGANAVHFSVLQEFVASMLGVRVGEMHQLSNNAHLYESTLPDRERILPYTGYTEKTVPLFGDMSRESVPKVLEDIERLWDSRDIIFLPESTAQLVGGMRQAWEGWKSRDWDRACSGLDIMDHSGHEDWVRACTEWLVRRRDKFS